MKELKLTNAQQIAEYFEREPMPIVGNGRVRATDLTVVETAPLYEQRRYKTDAEGYPLPVDELIEGTYGDAMAEGFAMLTDDEEDEFSSMDPAIALEHFGINLN